MRSNEEFAAEVMRRGEERRRTLRRRRISWTSGCVMAAVCVLSLSAVAFRGMQKRWTLIDAPLPTENETQECQEEIAPEPHSGKKENPEVNSGDDGTTTVSAAESSPAVSGTVTGQTSSGTTGKGLTNAENSNPTQASPTARQTAHTEKKGISGAENAVTFRATVKEISGPHVLVEPLEEETEKGLISFSCAGLADIGAEAGDTVEITYDGEIMESYPAQILASDWRLVE